VLLHSVLLSGVAGYVDAAGFVLLFGVFPAHLTGELVNDAIAISSGQLAARATRLWVLPVFVAAVVVAALVARRLRNSGRKPASALLALITASLALFSLGGLVASLHARYQAPLLTGACAVAAMGIQTVLMRESLTGCQTTVMTGNLAQVILEIVDQVGARLSAASAVPATPRSRLWVVAGALSAFSSCAVLGAWLARRFGGVCVMLPTFATAWLTVRAWRDERSQSASLAGTSDASLPWFTDDEFWPDSDAPRALSQPYTECSSVTRLKAGLPVLADEAPLAQGAASEAAAPHKVGS
jgi:uncharacterized membrane protein YoaK (UPF0700 family)